MMGIWRFRGGNGKGRSILLLYILHSLRNKPKSGYEVLKEIGERTKGEWMPSKGTIYPLLRQLEQERLVKVSKTDKRLKNIFELTDNGKNTLRQMRKRREESMKKFMLFRDLFIDVFGKEPEIERVLFVIRDIACKKSHKDKEKISRILKRCLAELKKVG